MISNSNLILDWWYKSGGWKYEKRDIQLVSYEAHDKVLFFFWPIEVKILLQMGVRIVWIVPLLAWTFH